MTITVNVSKLFSEIEPYSVSNSVENLGPAATAITWQNALSIALDHEDAFKGDMTAVTADIEELARSYGAWTAEEVEGWSVTETLAFFIQTLASELRTCLGVDDVDDLADCARLYDVTDWDRESEYPIGYYYVNDAGELMCDYYTGI